MIRFIHLADVHLGAVPDRGCPWSHEREEEIWETFRRVIASVRRDPVDLLFIVRSFSPSASFERIKRGKLSVFYDSGNKSFPHGRES